MNAVETGVFFFQIIGQLQGVEGFADVETHNLREYKKQLKQKVRKTQCSATICWCASSDKSC